MNILSRIFILALFGPMLAQAQDVTPAAQVKTLPGFRVELIHEVNRKTEGSWVALTVDPQGRIIAADQYGGL
ncbi:MAG: hypothetical protein EBR95_05225, partial [Verrucomicrobia bacterium]|nr:hypothetical protein [Verrucomicrobiota bacterium]